MCRPCRETPSPNPHCTCRDLPRQMAEAATLGSES